MSRSRRYQTPNRTSIRIEVDGDVTRAFEGEPIAVSLLAADRLVLGRSAKYHRPRGATCFSGDCEGCLMRVDGVPNVMTCCVPAKDGMKIVTQNVLGTAKVDLLSATDWFFPGGMDHHHMFTQFKPLNKAMQQVARRIAGIGKIPDQVLPPQRAIVQEVPVLVIGGGDYGMAAANGVREKGCEVLHVDRDSEVEGCERSTVLALFLDAGVCSVLLASHQESGLRVVRPKHVVMASGARPVQPALPGGDLPGVFQTAACRKLLKHGVLPGRRVAFIGTSYSKNQTVTTLLKEAGAEVVYNGELETVSGLDGGNRVSSIVLKGADSIAVDAVVLDANAYSSVCELSMQAGASTRFFGGGFAINADRRTGETDVPWLYAVGDCVFPNERLGDDDLRHAEYVGQRAALSAMETT